MWYRTAMPPATTLGAVGKTADLYETLVAEGWLVPVEPDIEVVANAVHEQWIRWAQTVMDGEPELSESRRMRWERYMVPYAELPEHVKEYDRKEARLIVDAALKGDT